MPRTVPVFKEVEKKLDTKNKFKTKFYDITGQYDKMRNYEIVDS